MKSNAELGRSEEHTSELQSREKIVCRLLLEQKKQQLRRRLQPPKQNALVHLPCFDCSAFAGLGEPLFVERRGFFFFNDTATTEIYTLSLHDALPILLGERPGAADRVQVRSGLHASADDREQDRKSTRLNSSHVKISYAVFCLKKKKHTPPPPPPTPPPPHHPPPP